MPCRRGMDRPYKELDSRITLLNESGVESDLGAVGISSVIQSVVECAEGIAIASTVLIVALVGCDDRKIGNAPVRQIRVKPTGTVKPDHIGEAVVVVVALLNVPKIRKGIVLYGV